MYFSDYEGLNFGSMKYDINGSKKNQMSKVYFICQYARDKWSVPLMATPLTTSTAGIFAKKGFL